jgi:hypothetical protein
MTKKKARKLKPTHKAKLVEVTAPEPTVRDLKVRMEGPPELLPDPITYPEPVPIEETGIWHWFKGLWE